MERNRQEGTHVLLSRATTNRGYQGANLGHVPRGCIASILIASPALASTPLPSSPAGASAFEVILYGALLVLLIALSCLLAVQVVRNRRRQWTHEDVARAQRDADLQLLSIAQTANLLLSKYDGSGHLVYISPGIKRITGVSAAQFVAGSASIDTYVHPSDRHHLQHAREMRGKSSWEEIEFEYRLKDTEGRWHWLHERQTPTFADGQMRGYDGIAFDFTDRVRFDQQQRRLLHLQQLSTTVLESFLATSDISHTTATMLDVVCRYFEFSAATLLERDDTGDFTIEHHWRHDRYRNEPEPNPPDSIAGERIAWWIERVRGGVPFAVLPDASSGAEVEAVRAITSVDVRAVLVVPVLVLGHLQLLIVLEDREEQRDWQPEELATIQTMAHAIARSLERNHAEQERTQFAETRRGHERSELIAHLASGIAHDFNNIVFAVSGRIQLLLKRAEDDRLRDGLNEIQRTLAGAKGIIGALLAMHRGTDRPGGSVRIGPETRAVATMIRRLIPMRIDFEADIKVPDELEANCLSEALHQLLMNLVVNARDAVEDGGKILVTVDEEGDEDRPIRIMVDDDGPGIPEDMLQEVFQPFVSTKSPSKATGLGLSIVERVSREHGGTVSLGRSRLGGLQATIALQKAEHAPPPDTATDEIDAHASDIRRVCIVEDAAVIRDVLARSFESIGIEVIQLGDALTVRELLSDAGTPIDVLVMDIDLPEMTGIECLEKLRAANILTPCVLITGGLSEPPTHLNHMRLLRKPFPIETLESTCRMLVRDFRAATSKGPS